MTDETVGLNKKAIALFERSLDEPSVERANWIRKEAGTNTAVCDIALELLHRDAKKHSNLYTGGALHNTINDMPPPDHIGAYKVTGLIGRGGMGAVYRGARMSGDFEHDVAIKVIRPGVLSEKLILRFENERQTLAKLSHPHIARLYDGGTLETGAPYIVMEYIDGLAIDKWVEAHKSSKKIKLRLFQAACKAVSYAHQNLIVHRDITPSNVLVDTSEQVKLIDFGIAKPVDEEEAMADANQSLASMSFTPGFAAPERLQGAVANTLSDIYSLGQLLDKLIDAPSQDNDLKAIVAKASALEPNQRYNSVDTLIDDLDNYTSGFPVAASRGGKTYRIAKFISRHKVGSSLASFTLVALVSAFFITFMQYQRAESARLDADKRFNDVRSLASTMMNDIYDKLYRVPGTAEASIELIAAAQIYLDELAAETKAPDDIKLEVAIGYTKLGTMLAGSKKGNVSDLEAADKHFLTSENMLLDLRKKEQDTNAMSSEILTALGKLYFYMAEISIQPRRKDELARNQLEKSIAVLEQAVLLDPSNLIPKLAFMHSACYIGEVALAQGKTSEAKDILRKCILDGEKLSKQFPNNEAILRLKSASGRTLANALSRSEDFSEAILVLDEAIVDLDAVKLLLNAENDSFTLRAQTMSYWRRGYAHTNIEKYEAALADYAKALEYTNIRLTKDPTDKDANWFYYTIIAEQATPLLNLGRIEEAESGLLVTLQWYEDRHNERPLDSSRLGNIFVHHYMMADFYKSINAVKKECSNYRQAYDYYELLEKTSNATNWDKDNLKSLKVDATHCDIDFKY